MNNEHTPRTFRKKPVEIQAVQWNGTAEGATPIIDWILSLGGDAAHQRLAVSGSRHNTRYDERIYIKTLEGPINASPNDWIIRGVQGEFYPCKPDIFAQTYDSVSSPVVPVATETGWPSLLAVPEAVVAVKDRNGVAWRRKSDGTFCGLAGCGNGHPELAPFVAVEEQEA